MHLQCGGIPVQEGILGKPTLKQVWDALEHQVLNGKAYLHLCQGLLKADRALLSGSETFFGLTIDGSLELAQMAIARLYDVTRGAVTVPLMLSHAALEISSFQRGTAQEVRAAIAESEQVVSGLEPILHSIRQRRDQWLAHLDARTVRDPNALAAKAKLTLPEVERAFADTERIVTKMTRLYDGRFGDLTYLGEDDYEAALDWIRKAKCTFIENYEKDFKLKWDGPRPKDCSGPLLKMN